VLLDLVEDPGDERRVERVAADEVGQLSGDLVCVQGGSK